MSRLVFVRASALAAVTLVAASAQAAVSVTSPSFTYSQNFDSLPSSGSTLTWVNDSTILGWDLYTGAGSAIGTLAIGNGGSNAGNFYSFGTTSSGERALGGVGSGGTVFGSPVSGAVAGYIAVAFKNQTGQELNGFTLGFDGEQWRNGGNTTAQTMELQYGFGSTFGAVSSWTTPGGSFNWASPVVGSTSAAVNGNAAGLVSGLGGTVENLSWGQDETLWVRWIEVNNVGNDHGLAIDNVQLTVTAVPEAETYAMLLAGLGAIGWVARRRAVR